MIKILVVDDEKEICEYIGDFFRDRGHETFTLTNPTEVVDFVDKEKPQLVLLDILMPQMSGLEVLKRIKQKHKENVKAIMVTVVDNESTREEAFRLGADDFISKPFTTDYLETVVMKKIEELFAFRDQEKSSQ